MSNSNLLIRGIPQAVPETVAAVCRSRLLKAVGDILLDSGLTDIEVTVSTSSINQSSSTSQNTNQLEDEADVEKRAKQYKSQQSLFTIEQLIVSSELREEILAAIELIQVESLVFDKWGLRKIEPFPRTALNFYGQPGTGKTLAAQAIAHSLNRPILVASYAQIESKFHGDGPKNVEALFYAATRDHAVLFIDEADSLLSKRLTDVTQGSERAANSMCSQLLICLEKFKGVVIFATNLVENYDKAFETRVRHIHFPMPNEQARQEIWRVHLVAELPCGEDVSVEELAKIDDVCGRDIKNAVIDAAVRTARQGKEQISLDQLVSAINRIKAARIQTNPVKKQKLDPETEVKIRAALARNNHDSHSDNQGEIQ